MEQTDTPRLTLTTAPQSGAVAIVQLHGPGAAAVLARATGRTDWPAGRYRLCDLAGLDEGLAVRLRDDWVQLMPHGGPRVVQKLIDRLLDLGAVPASASEPSDARQMYPEADSVVEAEALAAAARAASPAAVDLLLAQPALWREAFKAQGPSSNIAEDAEAILRRSAVLARLIDPPTVVVVGRPNVGKSTLTNAMLGRAVSLVADLPGTTRDWVAGLAELTGAQGPARAGVAVRWIDTPGLRASGDAIEREAIALAHGVIASADVLMVMRDPRLGWPELAALPREPDVYVMNKADEAAVADGEGQSAEAPLAISARDGRGLDRLQRRVLGVLGLDALEAEQMWAFSATLQAALRGEAGLGDYLRLNE